MLLRRSELKIVGASMPPTLQRILNTVIIETLCPIVAGYAEEPSVTYLRTGAYGQAKIVTINFCHIDDAMYELFHTFWYMESHKDLRDTLTAFIKLYTVSAIYGSMNRLVILTECKSVFTFADRNISFISSYIPVIDYSIENKWLISDTKHFRCIHHRIKNVESIHIIDSVMKSSINRLLITTGQKQIELEFTKF